MTRWRALFAAPSAVLVIAMGCGGSTAAIQGGDDGGGASDAPVSTDSPSGNNEAGPGGGSIQCGQATTCDPATQECCVSFGGGGDQCIAKGGNCQGVALSCTSASSCPSGDVCCASLQGRLRDGGTLATSCDPQCTQGEVQLCATTAECPQGDDCRRGFGGIRFCAPPFDGGFPPPRDGGGSPIDSGSAPDTGVVPDAGGE
jgi:hypothetical protein